MGSIDLGTSTNRGYHGARYWCFCVLSEKLFRQLWPGRSLDTTSVKLQTYSKQPLIVLGSVETTVCYEHQKVTLPLVRDGPPLFGKNWFSVIKLNWSHVHYLRALGVQDIKYEEVFGKELGTFKGPDVTISVDPDARLE